MCHQLHTLLFVWVGWGASVCNFFEILKGFHGLHDVTHHHHIRPWSACATHAVETNSAKAIDSVHSTLIVKGVLGVVFFLPAACQGRCVVSVHTG
jgi:hypothetical protein